MVVSAPPHRHSTSSPPPSLWSSVAATDGTEPTALAMGLDYLCPCECPMPEPFYCEYQRVSGGDTVVVE
jgi:hypothetical protein